MYIFGHYNIKKKLQMLIILIDFIDLMIFSMALKIVLALNEV